MENESVYAFCKQIPKGKVTTYKAIAEKLGTKAYQAIGQILSKNPNAPKVPCHRVIKSNGEIGGFMGSKDNQKKIELLTKEGVEIIDNKVKSKFIFLF